MSRPPVFPPPFPPPRPRPFGRTPPAIFLPVVGLLALGLVLREAAALWGLNGAVAEALLGATTGLGGFAVAAYLAKVVQRPGVLAEDLRVLPGRAGLAAAVTGLFLLAAALAPYGAGAAHGVLLAGLGLAGLLAAGVAVQILRGPPEGRIISPVHHLVFAGFVLAGLPAATSGWEIPALALLLLAMPVAGWIWVASLAQIIARVPPAPLRPLLALHLLPAAAMGLVAETLALHALAWVMAGIGGAILAALVVTGRWGLAAGFSPLWGAMTLPLAVFAGLMLALWPPLGAGLLLGSLFTIPPIAAQILRDWAKGGLAARTNAAQA